MYRVSGSIDLALKPEFHTQRERVRRTVIDLLNLVAMATIDRGEFRVYVISGCGIVQVQPGFVIQLMIDTCTDITTVGPGRAGDIVSDQVLQFQIPEIFGVRVKINFKHISVFTLTINTRGIKRHFMFQLLVPNITSLPRWRSQ